MNVRIANFGKCYDLLVNYYQLSIQAIFSCDLRPQTPQLRVKEKRNAYRIL
jgi:hypothetical protein